MAIILVCCGVCKSSTSWDTIGSESAVINVFQKELCKSQLDSLCIADTLENNYKKWVVASFGPDNKGKFITNYVFIKKGKEQKTYILEEITDSTFIVEKRIRIVK